MIEVTLPWPPTVNTYYRNVRGKTLISEDGRAYRKAVAEQVLVQRVKRQEGSLRVLIEAYPPDRRVRDLDNLPKAILDSLTKAGVWADDSQIDDLRIVRMPTIGGMVKVRVSQ